MNFDNKLLISPSESNLRKSSLNFDAYFSKNDRYDIFKDLEKEFPQPNSNFNSKLVTPSHNFFSFNDKFNKSPNRKNSDRYQEHLNKTYNPMLMSPNWVNFNFNQIFKMNEEM